MVSIARIAALLMMIAFVATGAARADSSVYWDLVFTGPLPSSPPNTDYLDLDGFDTPAAYVAEAKTHTTITICYISAGTLENWRPDRKAFRKLDRRERKHGRPAIIGRKYPDWPGERWLNARRYKVFLKLMVKRMKICKAKGFEMIEFDNIDGYSNDTGFKLKERHAVRYARALAGKARSLGLKPIQKNATEIAPKLEPVFEGMILESCVLFEFCGDGAPYRATSKPVLDVEYPEEWAAEGKAFDLTAACAVAMDPANDVSLVEKHLSLDAFAENCH